MNSLFICQFVKQKETFKTQNAYKNPGDNVELDSDRREEAFVSCKGKKVVIFEILKDQVFYPEWKSKRQGGV